MRRLTLMIVLMAACSICLASPPATQTASDFPALRAKLAKAMADLAEMTKERDELRQELSDLRAMSARDARKAAATERAGHPPFDDIPSMRKAFVEKIHMGMTYDEVAAVLGKHVSETREADNIVRKYQDGDYGYYIHGRYTIECSFDDRGRLVDAFEGD